MSDQKESSCEREPNCAFYLNNRDDDSRIGCNGDKVYCVVAACRNYLHESTVLQFDDDGRFMRQCLTGAEIEGGFPSKLSGEQIPLESIESIGPTKKLVGTVTTYERVSQKSFAMAS